MPEARAITAEDYRARYLKHALNDPNGKHTDRFRRLGFMPEKAAEWVNAGYEPAAAARYVAAGIRHARDVFTHVPVPIRI